VLTSVLATRDPRGYSAAVAGALMLNAAANAVVLPHHGAIGAAWVTLASQVVFAAAMWRRLLRITRPAAAGADVRPDPGTADPRTPLVPI
jgi:hypothetical protein